MPPTDQCINCPSNLRSHTPDTRCVQRIFKTKAFVSSTERVYLLIRTAQYALETRGSNGWQSWQTNDLCASFTRLYTSKTYTISIAEKRIYMYKISHARTPSRCGPGVINDNCLAIIHGLAGTSRHMPRRPWQDTGACSAIIVLTKRSVFHPSVYWA